VCVRGVFGRAVCVYICMRMYFNMHDVEVFICASVLLCVTGYTHTVHHYECMYTTFKYIQYGVLRVQ
jgi:hypothetical protein